MHKASLGRKRLLGISLYPEKQSQTEMQAYLKSCYALGYRRLYLTLINLVEAEIPTHLSKYKEVATYAKKLGFFTILDVAPRIFKALNLSPSDLSFFAEMNVQGIRIDVPFTGFEEAEMTYNPYGLIIELNLSHSWQYIDLVMSFKPKLNNLWGMHNFYPQKFSGLGREFYESITKNFRKYNIPVACYISAADAKVKPWPISDRNVVLEEHRSKDVIYQAKEFWASGLVDDLIITESDVPLKTLTAISKIDPNMIELRYLPSKQNNTIETTILRGFHFRRGDASEFLIRSTQSRVKYRSFEFPNHDDKNELTYGDITIGNNSFANYKGELNLLTATIGVDRRRNLVARVIEEDIDLIKYIEPWAKFKLVPVIETKN